ncbi:hypothetical protein D3C77_665310 [compost metagenome]
MLSTWPWSEVIASCCSICLRVITVIFCGVLPASLLPRVALTVRVSSSSTSSARAGAQGKAMKAREMERQRRVLRNTWKLQID